jgi:hypothetical protein
MCIMDPLVYSTAIAGLRILFDLGETVAAVCNLSGTAEHSNLRKCILAALQETLGEIWRMEK